MGSESPPIPRKFASLVSHLLQPGESIVWWGQPRPWTYSQWSLLALAAFACVAGALLLSALHQPSAEGRNLALGVGISAWLYFAPLLGLLAWQWSTARRTLYLLTSERALWCRPRYSGNYDLIETWPEDLEAAHIPSYGDPLRPGSMAHWLRQHEQIQRLIDKTLRPKLVGRLKHPNNDVRRKAIRTLVAQASKGKVPIASLVAALSSDDSFIRAQAAIALGKLGASARPAEAILRRATFDENPAVSQAALHAIEELRRAT